MKRVLKVSAVLLGAPILAFALFYLWASSGSLSSIEYEAGNLIVSEDLPDPAPRDPFTIVTYNIGYASGLSNNTGDNASETQYDENLQFIIRALQTFDPDFVAFQEIDYGSARSYHRDQLDIIADALSLKYRVQGYNWDKHYLPFPYWPPAEHFGRVLSGQALASAHPVHAHSKVTLLEPKERPFYYNQFYLDRTIQISKVTIQDRTLTIMNVHLEAYMNDTRRLQAREVVEAVRAQQDGPLILLGDFNAQPPWVNSGADELGRTDTTIATILEGTGLNKAIPEQTYGDTKETRHLTFRSDDPGVALDHIFYNDAIEVLSAHVLDNAGTGSDHLPVMMTFRFRTETIPER